MNDRGQIQMTVEEIFIWLLFFQIYNDYLQIQGR